MTLEWNSFTPFSALAGGLLIGSAASLLVILKGRIAGISGIVGGLLQRQAVADYGWRIAFIAGLVLAPLLYQLVARLPQPQIDADFGLLAAAGFLVGFGTRLGSGCTSGHGVCGLSRLSPRSIAATLTFMATGVITVFISRHLLA
jgi:uncharacterized membrane protein YedE/YeeE